MRSHCENDHASPGDRVSIIEVRKWWALQGSNLRPTACKAVALPAELSARIFQGGAF